jgi:hypothetical protein
MGVRTLRMAVGAVMVGVAFLAVGCAAGGGSAPSKQPGPAASRVLPAPFTVTARYAAKMLGLSHPDALAIGPDGNLYVTDLSQRVTVISPAGKVLRRWGKLGPGPGEFNFIAFDPNRGDISLPHPARRHAHAVSRAHQGHAPPSARASAEIQRGVLGRVGRLRRVHLEARPVPKLVLVAPLG